MPRGSDASATAAVPAMERLRRLERVKTTSCLKVVPIDCGKPLQWCLLTVVY